MATECHMFQQITLEIHGAIMCHQSLLVMLQGKEQQYTSNKCCVPYLQWVPWTELSKPHWTRATHLVLGGWVCPSFSKLPIHQNIRPTSLFCLLENFPAVGYQGSCLILWVVPIFWIALTFDTRDWYPTRRGSELSSLVNKLAGVIKNTLDCLRLRKWPTTTVLTIVCSWSPICQILHYLLGIVVNKTGFPLYVSRNQREFMTSMGHWPNESSFFGNSNAIFFINQSGYTQHYPPVN